MVECQPRAVDSALDDALGGRDADPWLTQLAHLNPAGLLAGDVPRLVDERQLADTLWNTVRHEIVERREPGQFILSGSATPMTM